MSLVALENQLLSPQEIKHNATLEWASGSLNAALQDTRPIVRANAARILGQQIESAEEVDREELFRSLSPLIHDREPLVRKAILEIASSHQHSTALKLLLEGLLDDDETLREAAKLALHSLSCEELHVFLASLNPTIIEQADELLFSVLLAVGPSAVSKLLETLDGESPLFLRSFAARGLGKFGRHASPALETLLKALKMGDPLLKRASIEALDAIARGHEPDFQSLNDRPKLFDNFYNTPLGVEDLAGQIEDVEEIQLLSIAEDDAALIRANVALALGCLEELTTGGAEKLGVMLFDREESVREAAMDAIIRLGNKAVPAAPWILNVLNAPHRDILGARSILWLFEHRFDIHGALIEGLRTDPEHIEGGMLPLFLKFDANMMPILKDGLSHDSALIRLNAIMGIRLLWKVCDLETLLALKHVVRYEQSPDLMLRARKIVLMIEDIKPKTDKKSHATTADKVIDALDALAEDSDPNVRRRALNVAQELIRARPEPQAPMVPGFEDEVLDITALETHERLLIPGNLLVLIHHSNPFIRANAAMSLRLLKVIDEEVADIIATIFPNHEEFVRKQAVSAFIGADLDILSHILDVLISRLGDEDGEVRAIVKTLFLAHGERGVWLAAEGLQSTVGHDWVLPFLVEQGASALPIFIAKLEDKSSRTQALSALGLYRLGGNIAAPSRDALMAAIRREPRLKEVGMMAVRVIDKALAPPLILEPRPMPVPGFDLKLLDDELLNEHRSQLSPELLSALLRDGRAIVRANAVRAHGTIGQSNPTLGLLLKDSDQHVRLSVCHVAQRLGAGAANLVPDLFSVFGRSSGALRDALLKTLLNPKVVGIPAWVAAFSSPHAEVAVLLAPLLEGPQLREILNSALDTSATLGRAHATTVAGGLFAHEELAREIIDRASKDLEDPVLRASERALVCLDDSLVLPPEPLPSIAIEGFEVKILSPKFLSEHVEGLGEDALIIALSDGRQHVRVNAVVTLGLLAADTFRSAAALLVAFKDGDRAVRMAVPKALATQKYQSHLFLPTLIDLLIDPDEELQAEAFSAISSLQGALEEVIISSLKRVNTHRLDSLIDLGERLPDLLTPVFKRLAQDISLSGLQRSQASMVLAVLETGEMPPAGPAPFVIDVPGFEDGPLSAEILESHADVLDPVMLCQAIESDGLDHVRENAARALGVIRASDRKSLGALKISLKDSAADVARAAATSLGQISAGASEIIPAMISGLPSADVLFENALIEGISAFGEAGFEEIIQMLGSKDWDLFEGALESILKNNSEWFLSRLRKTMDNKSLSLLARKNAELVFKLIRAGDTQPLVKESVPLPIIGFDQMSLNADLLSKQRSNLDINVLLSLLKDGRELVRENAARAIGVLDFSGGPALTALSITLKDSEPAVVCAAVRALGRSEAAMISVPLLGALIPAADRALESLILEIFSNYGEEIIKPIFLLLDQDWGSIGPVLEPIIIRYSERIFEGLSEITEDLNYSFKARENARRTIRKMKAQASKMMVMEDSPMPVEGFDSISLSESVLKKNKKSLEINTLIKLLEDGRELVRENAARAVGVLGKKKGAGALPHLALHLRDVSVNVQIAAVQSLTSLKLSPELVIPRLVRTMRGADGDLREVILKAFDVFGEESIEPFLQTLDAYWRQVSEEHVLVVQQTSKFFVDPLMGLAADPKANMRARENALDLLVSLGKFTLPLFDQLVELLSEKKGMIRVKVVRVIAASGHKFDDKFADSLRELMTKDLRRSLRHAVLDAFDNQDIEE